MVTVRRKYWAGGDVWLADCVDRYVAFDLARKDSESFQHGAVYVILREGKIARVVACFACGCASHWNWWTSCNSFCGRPYDQ